MRVRKGIEFSNGICRCDKHSKEWKEGDKFEEYGGQACRECILNAYLFDKSNKGSDE